MPPISPPPPTGTITASTSGASSSISRPTVPWPASTSGSSNGCTSVRPVSAMSASSRANASPGPDASRSTAAPYPRVAAIFCADAPFHITTSASIPSAAAPKAVACAWLPALIAITPRAFSASLKVLILLSAPRTLNDPVRWKSSHLRRAPIVRLPSSGVRGSRSPMVSRARRTSSRVGAMTRSGTPLPVRFEEEHSSSGARVERVGGARVHRYLDAHVREITPSLGEAFVLGADQEGGRVGVVGVGVRTLRAERRGDLLVREGRQVVSRHCDDRQREDGAGR